MKMDLINSNREPVKSFNILKIIFFNLNLYSKSIGSHI